MDFDGKMVDVLCRYIKINTSNPPGDCSEAVAFLKGLLQELGFAPETGGIGPEKESLWVNLGGDEEPGVVLIHHMDVVPAKEEEWSFHPFCGEVRDGYVLGRGTLDTKGLGVAHLFGALKAIKEKGGLRKKVFFVANPDEEIGGDDGAGYFVKNWGNLFANCFGLNEGGIGVKDLFGDGDFFLLNVWEKGPVWLKLRAHGRAGHGSRPTERDATYRLVRALDRLVSREVPMEITEPVAMMLEELRIRGLVGDDISQMTKAIPEMEAITRNTVAITMLEGGFKPNVIPAVAEATVDVRILPGKDPEDVVEEIRDLVRPFQVDVEVIYSARPSGSPISEYFQLVKESLHEVYPGSVVVPYLSTGFTDSRYYRNLGIPVYGILPCLIPREELGRIHGVDERISVDSLIRASEVIKKVILNVEEL